MCEKLNDGNGSEARKALSAAALSAVIAAVALLINAYNVYITTDNQTNGKKIDSAITWCKDFYLPNFVNYQERARRLKNENIFRKDYDIIKLDKNDRESVTEAVVGLMNYIDQGASLV